MDADVVIAGGGPAGTACTLALRAHAPSLSVIVVEASHYDAPRIGETLPPHARAILQHLGVFEPFLGQQHREVHGTTAVWGDAVPRENDFLLGARGPGWHLDRAAFDAMLADEAERRGATVLRGTPWRDGMGRFVVDATGSAAIATHIHGARFTAVDHLVSFARLFDEDDAGRDPRTHVRTFADGWWYTAALPHGRRIVACLTDADVARRMRLADTDEWMRAAGELVGDARPCSGIIARAAESRCLDPVAGEEWIAIGDAASRFDPLSSQGIVKAMRSGIFAAYAIGDLLVRGDRGGMQRYARMVRAEFDAYRAVRAKFYAEETRWPGSPFWSSRASTHVTMS